MGGKKAGPGKGGGARRHRRRAMRLRMGKIADLDDHFLSECVIRDLSDGGARLVVSQQTALPDVIILFDELDATIVPATIRWRRGNEAGICFEVLPAELRQFRSSRLRSLAHRYYAVRD